MRRFGRLKAWQACHQLALDVYRVTAALPTDGCEGLAAHTRRAAIGAAARIADGSERGDRREFAVHLENALAQLAVLSSCIRLSADLDLITPTDATTLEIQGDHAAKLTAGLRRTTLTDSTRRPGRAKPDRED